MDTVRVTKDNPEGAEGLGIEKGMEGLVMQRTDGWAEVMLIKNKGEIVGLFLREEDLESTEAQTPSD